MKLQWRAGKFCLKECYYVEASSPLGTYTLSRARVCGEWRYALYCGKEQIGGIMLSSEEAKAAAQQHEDEHG